MQEIILENAPYFITDLIRIFTIYLMVQGVVYILGRMLCIVNSEVGRNAVAVIFSIVFGTWSVYLYDIWINTLDFLWKVSIFSITPCILFVLIGWKLFDRTDHFLDKKFAEDNCDLPKTPKKKRGIFKK